MAIFMFFIFLSLTLFVTYWAARHTKNLKTFYAAGGNITGLQKGLAISGDFMSAASFLGISGLVFSVGFDGLIYSIGFLVGWPIVLLLIAEPLRNLGKYTFAHKISRILVLPGQNSTRITALIWSILNARQHLGSLFNV